MNAAFIYNRRKNQNGIDKERSKKCRDYKIKPYLRGTDIKRYFANWEGFYLDTEGHYLNNSSYFISVDDKYLLCFLNSELFKFYKINTFVAFGGAKARGRCKLDYNNIDKQVIDSLVYELYFKEKFEEEGLETNLFGPVESYLKDIGDFKTEEEKLEVVKEVVERIKSDRAIKLELERIKNQEWVMVMEDNL